MLGTGTVCSGEAHDFPSSEGTCRASYRAICGAEPVLHMTYAYGYNVTGLCLGGRCGELEIPCPGFRGYSLDNSEP